MSTARTLAGELLIVLASDAERPEGQISRYALTAAMLAELALAGRIEVGNRTDPTVSLVADADPMGERTLDDLIQVLRKCDGARVSEILEYRRTDFSEQITEDLVQDGLVTLRKGFLGEPWAQADTQTADPILDRLVSALETPKKAKQRDAVLVRLLAGRQAAASLLLARMDEHDEDSLHARINKLTGPKRIDENIARLLDAAWTAERM